MTTTLRRIPQQERSRALVERVLDTADRLVAAEGVGALTTTRIAHEAGVAVGSVYQYFPDTGAIVTALATRHMDNFEAAMDEVAAAAVAEGWDDPVGTLIDFFAARYRDAPGYRALWFGRALSSELLEADRRNNHALARGVRGVLAGLGIGREDRYLVTVSEAAVHTADALLQEAFRRDPDGEPALLEEAKVILRAYMEKVAEHYA